MERLNPQHKKLMKKIIHALTIIDKSSSMESFRGRTIEGINSSLSGLRKEVDENTTILNTLLQFSVPNSLQRYGLQHGTDVFDKKFVFSHVGKPVTTLSDLTEKDYLPDGGTPLLDAIGYGIEKVKEFHGDSLGNDNLKIIVTIFTDGEENSSTKWNKDEIKKKIDYYQSDGKWTFTFVGCGSLENVTTTSGMLGITSANTVAYSATDSGTAEAYGKISTSYMNFAQSTKRGVVDNDLFAEK